MSEENMITFQSDTSGPGLVLPDRGPGLVRHDAVPVLALGFTILNAGITALREGDVEMTRPSSDIGVQVTTNRPAWLRSGTRSKTLEIFRYRSTAPAGEAVNVKLNALCQYNGLEVGCTFQLPADGQRSRWMTDTKITISNPLGLLEQASPQSWQDLGIMTYPVVFVPVSIFVDEPWPNDNQKYSFQLVLSGMYGFGAHGYSVKHDYRHWTD